MFAVPSASRKSKSMRMAQRHCFGTSRILKRSISISEVFDRFPLSVSWSDPFEWVEPCRSFGFSLIDLGGGFSHAFDYSICFAHPRWSPNDGALQTGAVQSLMHDHRPPRDGNIHFRLWTAESRVRELEYFVEKQER